MSETLDPSTVDSLNKSFEKMISVLGAANSAANQRAKSSTEAAMQELRARRDLEKQLEKDIREEAERNGKKVKDAKALAQATAETILQERKSAETNAQLDAQNVKRNQDIAGSVKSLLTGFMGMVNANQTATMSIYASDKAYTSVIPTLDLLSGAFKATIEAAGLALSNLSISIAGFGASTGDAPKALSKLGIAAVDVATQIAKMQLEMAQGYKDEYDQLSEVGVTFGGRLKGMSAAAADGGLNLKLYSDFVKNNIESLSKMGGTVEDAAARVMKMGKAALKGNDQLLVMYGGFGKVDAALADYASQLASSGFDFEKNVDLLSATSAEYLLSLKEMENITGKNAKQVKAEREEAMKDVAFKQKINDMRNSGDVKQIAEATALENQLVMIRKWYGAQAASTFQELIGNEGNLYSRQSIIYANSHDAQMKIIEGYRQNAKLEANVRMQANQDVSKANDAQVEAQDKAMRSMVRIGQYANKAPEAVKQYTEAVGQSIDAESAKKGFINADLKLRKEFNKGIDDAGQNQADLQRKQLEIQQGLDKTIEDRMGKMASIAGDLADIQGRLIKQFGDGFTDSVGHVIAGLDELAKHLPGGSGSTSGGAGGGAAGAPSRASTMFTKFKGGLKTLFTGGEGGRQAEAAGLRVKSDESTGGGAANEKLIGLASEIQNQLGGDLKYFSAFNDRYHHGLDSSSAHTSGTALDFVLNDPKNAANIADKVKGMPGVSKVINEYANLSAGGTGGHIHAEVPAMAEGGVTKGVSIAGEGGPEAIVPLPDGRTIPVKIDWTEMREAFNEMIRVMKDHKDVSEKTLRASQ